MVEAAVAMDLVGQIIDGRYDILYRIHTSRSATIFLARDQFLCRSVVLKVLHPSLASHPAYVERFRREACTAASLSHPNLIAVYNLGASAGTYYIVMEHVTGPSLGESLRVSGRLSEIWALQITAQVAAALAAAHERGVVHRDIRSHNILLSAGSQVKVTDFGCACTAGSRAADPASDLYNLGLLLHEMVTGDRQVMSPSVWARLHLSPYTDALLRCALAPNIGTRFSTADEMRAAIEGAISHVALEAFPSGQARVQPARAAVHAADSHRVGLLDLFRPRSARLAS